MRGNEMVWRSVLPWPLRVLFYGAPKELLLNCPDLRRIRVMNDGHQSSIHLESAQDYFLIIPGRNWLLEENSATGEELAAALEAARNASS
jgi:hypothetical protein